MNEVMSNDKTASRNMERQKASSSIDVLMSKPAFSGGNLLTDQFRLGEKPIWLGNLSERPR